MDDFCISETRRLRASERLESVEEGIDDDGLEEEHQQHDGMEASQK